MKAPPTARPVYPPLTGVVLHAAKHICRVAVMCTALTLISAPAVIVVADWTGLDDVDFFAVAATTVYGVTAAVYALFFELCDRTGLFCQYRVERNGQMKNAEGLKRRAVCRVLFFHGISLGVMYFKEYTDPYPPLRGALPDPCSLLLRFVSGVVIQFEVMGYAIHYLQHHWGWLYRATHKLHHGFAESVSYASEYVSLPEIILGSFGNYDAFRPCGIAPYLVYIAWRISDTYEVHSGYSFAGTWPSRLGLLNGHRAVFHDYHHQHPDGNYGENIFMDFLFGTCDGYLCYMRERGLPVV